MLLLLGHLTIDGHQDGRLSFVLVAGHGSRWCPFLRIHFLFPSRTREDEGSPEVGGATA